MIYRGRIVDISKQQNHAIYLKQGIKGSEQYKYSNYSGGNGTYVTGGEYLGTSLNIKIFIFDLEKSITFDVYEEVLLIKGKSRISSKLLEEIQSYSGEKVHVYTTDNVNFSFDVRQIIQI